MAAERGRRGELFGEDAPVGENDALRRQVVGTRRNLDIAKPLGSRMLEQRAERLRGVAATPFRGHDRVANVAETVKGSASVPGCQRKLALPQNSPSHIQIRYPGRRRTELPSGNTMGSPAASRSTRLARKASASAAIRASSSRAASGRRLSGDQPLS